ncbi:MAG: DNA mismatch repair endonuclease MutL [Ruminococcaceae bacterium]|nr:DNA mismatch repair endonuclease MutL [Oscillospiraceae bacterium]
MGRINVLSFAVANLIAAGEVVDRPASAVKELVENAIDSGANRITVEIQNGGVSFIRVCDNGCGMEPEELPIAIRRHATSKIKTAADLESVETLGFRGEALAAIASVSNMRIISKTAEAQYGAMLEVSAGNMISLTERACATGTTVIVEDLFANVPARRKFLKRDVTEAAAVNVIVEKVALSKPRIAFKMIQDGAVKFETAGDGDLKNTIYAIFGREFAMKTISVNAEIDGVHVSGFIGRSDNFKANRNYQNFFINGRYVKSKTASAAIEQAYSSYIPSEKYPCCVLNIEVSPRAVDVNVHPAKLEVKFSNEKPVFDAVYYTVRAALEDDITRPDFQFETQKGNRSEPKKKNVVNAFVPVEDLKKSYPNLKISFDGAFGKAEVVTPKVAESKKEEPSRQVSAKQELVLSKSSEVSAAAAAKPVSVEEPLIHSEPHIQNEVTPPLVSSMTPKNDKTAPFETKVEAVSQETKKISDYRIVGEAFHSYVFVEREDKVIVIDKHAAHERILFEELRSQMTENQALSQLLMLPIEVMLTTDEITVLENYREEIEKVGFSFELKKHSAEITAVPSSVSQEAVCDMFVAFADRLLGETGSIEVSRKLIFERALYQASCKAAIKAGREYPAEHIKWLVDKMMQLPDITFCPHGRPVAVEMSKNSLDKQFERK